MRRGVGELDATTWLEEHGDALFRYAIIRVRDSSVAEDLVQETLLSAMTAMDSFQGASSASREHQPHPQPLR